MNRSELVSLIRQKKSFLCVGLDSDPEKIPAFLKENFEDPVYEFNRQIIDATLPYAVACKPNIAFYESMGSAGWKTLEKTMEYLNSLPAKVFSIADAKRGDIGNSAAHYARAFFDTLGFDAVTVSPYMGEDSVAPFLAYKDKWTILLALTSNAGSEDFQVLQPQIPALLERLGIRATYWKKLYELVMEKALTWENAQQIMFVVGATQAEMLSQVREIAPDSFLLVPGVGAQGGSLEQVAQNGMNKDCGLLVNASRSILYASSGEDFTQAAAHEARKMQEEMEKLLKDKGIV
ncbi:MAG: orotidine-5'-phosphate decarboxylase [Bacteroidales bacterium]